MRLFRCNNSDSGDEFDEGFHDLPSARKREAMSVIQLAEILRPLQKDSVAYIVISHELNLKIAKEQSKATLKAGWIGAGATLAAAVLSFLLGAYTERAKVKEPAPVANFSQPSGSPVELKGKAPHAAAQAPARKAP